MGMLELILIAGVMKASAAIISVDVGSYEGQYKVDNASFTKGTKSWNLAVGGHRLVLANNSYFDFQVTSDNKVVSLKPNTATGTNSTLKFLLTAIHVNPSNYEGLYTILGMTNKTGQNSIVLVQNMAHRLITDVGGEIATLSVDALGAVTTAAQNLNITGNSVTFKTLALNIDPKDYSGLYMLGNTKQLKGPQLVNVIQGAHHRVKTPENGTIVNFRMNESGEVDAASFGHDNIETSAFTMAFKTVSVIVNAGEYRGQYACAGARGLVGNIELLLIEDAEHRLSTNMNSVITNFTVDQDGSVHITGTAPVFARGSVISFDLVHTKIVPPQGAQSYKLDSVGNFSGTQDVWLIPGIQNRAWIGSTFINFRMDSCDAQGLPFAAGPMIVECAASI